MKRFVAVLDILGFGSLDIHSDPYKAFEVINDRSYITRWLPLSGVGTEYSDMKIQAIFALDTLYLWTNDNSSLSFRYFLATVHALLINYFHDELQLRGAITFGEAQIIKPSDNQQGIIYGPIVTGAAFIEAHKLEKCQNWAGCIVAKSALEQYNRVKTESDPTADTLQDIVQYDVPLKDKKLKEKKRKEAVVNWFENTKFFQDGTLALTEEEIRRRFASHGRSIETEDIQIKIDNTITFFRTCGN